MSARRITEDLLDALLAAHGEILIQRVMVPTLDGRAVRGDLVRCGPLKYQTENPIDGFENVVSADHLRQALVTLVAETERRKVRS